MFSAGGKAELLTEIFSKNSHFEDLSISLYAFLSRNNLKLQNILVTPKLAKKVIIELGSSGVSRPNCILVVVLKNCESEILCILSVCFNMCFKESCSL